MHRDGTVEIDRQLVVNQDAPEDGHANLLLHKGNDASAFISLVRDGTEEGGSVATGEISLSSNYLTLDASEGIYFRTNDANVTAMRINPDGRIAIGHGGAQAADGYQLDIGGNTRIQKDEEDAYLSVVRNDTNDTEIRIEARDGAGEIGTVNDTALRLKTNDVEHFHTNL